MILDSVFSILTKASTGVLGLSFGIKHSTFVRVNGEKDLCCILMHTFKLGISINVQTAIGILRKMDHVDMKKALSNVINGTHDVSHFNYVRFYKQKIINLHFNVIILILYFHLHFFF